MVKFLKKLYRKIVPYKKRETLKVLLLVHSNRNLGDTVIADNTKFLLEKISDRFKYKLEIFTCNMLNTDIFQVRFADCVVFAGGGLVKFRAERFSEILPSFINEAEKYNVPVFLNAVGVEGYDETDERCLALKKALNLSCVKGISCRDDIQTLKNCYIYNKNIRLKAVCDPAVWTGNSFLQIKRNAESDTVGLGIAREGIFTDHGIEKINKEFLLEFWKNTAAELEKQGLKWKLFTNGLDRDERFAKEVLAYIGRGEILPQPAFSYQLVENISSFKGIISCRMHANIIAYSVKIPSVGLVWNDKLSLWGKKIKHPERFLSPDEITPHNAVKALLTACSEKQTDLCGYVKKSTEKELKRFLKSFCKPRETEKIQLDFQKHMLAAALGGMEFKYKNTNSVQAFRYSLSQGYVNFETDVRLTSDKRLVCVNRWHKDTFKAMGLDSEPEPLSYVDFIRQKYYSHFEACDFSQLIGEISNHSKKKLSLVLDIGKPSRPDFDEMLSQFSQTLPQILASNKKLTVYVRVQRKTDAEAFINSKLKIRLIYLLPDRKGDGEDYGKICRDTCEFCKNKKISVVSMSDKVFSEEVSRLLSEYGLSACIFTYTNTEDIQKAISMGALFVGSCYYSPEYMKRLCG